MTVVTDTHPETVQKSFRQPGIISELAPSILMEVSQEGAMDIPANGGVGAQPLEDVVIGTRYIYTLALALVGLALATSAILFFVYRFLKGQRMEEIPCDISFTSRLFWLPCL